MSSEAGGVSPVFDFFFLRRVPAIIWMLLLLGIGLLCYRAMVKEALPDLEIPTFSITTIWEGATSSMVEKSITQKIENSLRGLKGLKKIHSRSAYSASFVSVTFTAESRVSESMRLLQQQITGLMGEMPRDIKRPRIEATSVSDLPIVTVTFSGRLDKSELERLAEHVKQDLERIGGIRKVRPVGVRKQVVHVQLLPERVKALGISPLEVRSRIVQSGMDAPWGKFENTDVNFTLKMDGAYNDIAGLKELFIAKTPGGGVIRLGDIARVRQTFELEREKAALSWRGGDFIPVVALSVLKAPGKDTVDLVAKVKTALGAARAEAYWPREVRWQLVGNEAQIIVDELGRGMTNGVQAMLAVFLVLLVLLSWREAVVASLSVPLTLCGTLGILWACGYTVNLLMLIGMVIALGLLVDDFILIMEGMHEGIYIKGCDFAGAVRNTIGTYAVPSFSGSVTTILVFAPLAFIPGVDGKFMRVIPFTAAACLVVSFLVSIIIGPVLLRFFIKPGSHGGQSLVDRISHRCEQVLGRWLGRVVVPNKRRAPLWTAAAAALFCISLFAASDMRVTLYPKEDGRVVGITVEFAEGLTFEAAERTAERIGGVLRAKAEIEHVFRVVGGRDPYSDAGVTDDRSETPHISGFGCFLVPGGERDMQAHEFAARLKSELTELLVDEPGARVFVKAASGGPSSEDPLQISLTGTDVDELRDMAEEVRLHLQTVRGVFDVRDNIGPARSEIRYRPMQEALDHHKLLPADFAGQMSVYMNNEKVGKYQRPGTQKDLDIRLGTWWNSQSGKMAGPRDWRELAGLSIVNAGGDTVPLHGLAVPEWVSAAPAIRHIDGRRAVTVKAKIQGIYMPEVLEILRPELDRMKQGWPGGYDYSFLGEEDADRTYGSMFISFFAAIILVYGILALLFDSLFYPGIILSTVLFALVGVFFGFMLAGIPFSFSAAIGIVALVGIVVNDAIIVVQTIRNHRAAGASIFEAARNGASDRLRPIVSTTITNFAGLLPLALSDPGWAPICQAIIFGEITATVGAVILIPALFVLLTPERGKA